MALSCTIRSTRTSVASCLTLDVIETAEVGVGEDDGLSAFSPRSGPALGVRAAAGQGEERERAHGTGQPPSDGSVVSHSHAGSPKGRVQGRAKGNNDTAQNRNPRSVARVTRLTAAEGQCACTPR